MLAVSRGVAAVSAGRVVGTAFCTPFGTDLAAVNMIIVEAGMRGSGLGRRLMNEVMAFAGERTLRLVATEAGRPLYEKLGFVAAGEIVQHQGIAPEAVGPEPAADWAGPGRCAGDRRAGPAAFGADRGALVARMLAEGRAAVLRRRGAGRGVCALPRIRKGARRRAGRCRDPGGGAAPRRCADGRASRLVPAHGHRSGNRPRPLARRSGASRPAAGRSCTAALRHG